MDYCSAMRRLAMSIVALAALRAQDPEDVLAQARDKLLPRVPRGSKFVCTETIDRSYFHRGTPPLSPPSCEQISINRKKGRNKCIASAIAAKIIWGYRVPSPSAPPFESDRWSPAPRSPWERCR